MLRTTVRDCLLLNWALPAESLPEAPSPLRYQLHSWEGRDWVFVTAALFHQDSLHFTALPMLRFGYPQLNVRFCVLDHDGVPSVLCRRMLMPAWVAPGVRLLLHQPAARARLNFPHPSRHVNGGPWVWKAEREGTLQVRAWPDSPWLGEGPRLGSWEDSVRYFQERPRGYTVSDGAPERVTSDQPSVPVWPLKVELEGDGLVPRLLGVGAETPWPGLHSAWLCPEIPFVFEFGIVIRMPVAAAMPQPAAGRVVSFRWPVEGRPLPVKTASPERRRVAC